MLKFIYEERKIVCLFVTLKSPKLSHIVPRCCTLGIVGKPLMRMGASHNVFTYGGGVIEY